MSDDDSIQIPVPAAVALTEWTNYASAYAPWVTFEEKSDGTTVIRIATPAGTAADQEPAEARRAAGGHEGVEVAGAPVDTAAAVRADVARFAERVLQGRRSGLAGRGDIVPPTGPAKG